MSDPLPPILVVDVETSGLDPHLNGLVEIGALWITGPRVGEEFDLACRPRPGAVIDGKAIEVNGCNWLGNTGVLTEGQAITEFCSWVGEGKVLLAGMNPYCDLSFLRAAHRQLPYPRCTFPFSHRTLDMHTLAIAYAAARGEQIPATGYHTDAILELLGLPPEPRPHRAICGARCEAEAFRILLGYPSALTH
jgi:DNA polymerase III epsilon subunit-like protein